MMGASHNILVNEGEGKGKRHTKYLVLKARG